MKKYIFGFIAGQALGIMTSHMDGPIGAVMLFVFMYSIICTLLSYYIDGPNSKSD